MDEGTFIKLNLLKTYKYNSHSYHHFGFKHLIKFLLQKGKNSFGICELQFTRSISSGVCERHSMIDGTNVSGNVSDSVDDVCTVNR